MTIRRYLVKLFLCGMVVLTMPTVTFAQQPSEVQAPQQTSQLLTLSQALKLADENNPKLLAARKTIPLSQQDIKIANEIPNPQAFYQWTWGTQYRLDGQPDIAGINQTVETNGKRKKRTQTAIAQSRLTIQQYMALRWDIRNQTRQAYSDYASAEANLKAIDAQAALLQTLVDIANKRFQAGSSPEGDVIQAELALEQTDTQREQALGQLNQAKTHLNALIGNPQGQKEILDLGVFDLGNVGTELAPLPEEGLPSIENMVSKALESRPDLKAAIEQVKVNEGQLSQEKAKQIPDVQFALMYLYSYTPNPYSPVNIKKYFDGPSAGATFDLPVFHHQQAEIRKARTAIYQSQLSSQALIKQILNDISMAYSELKVAKQNIDIYKSKLLPESSDVVHLTQESYQYGRSPLSNVILAQQADQQLRQSYVQAITDYHNAWKDLETAVGTPLM